MKGYRVDFNDADPDDVLDELFQKRLREAERQQAAEDLWRDDDSSQPSASQKSAPRSSAEDSLYRAYARLEIEPGTPLPKVKKAWRKLMSKYHPDKHAGDPKKQEIATKVAAALTEAYHTIRQREER